MAAFKLYMAANILLLELHSVCEQPHGPNFTREQKNKCKRIKTLHDNQDEDPKLIMLITACADGQNCISKGAGLPVREDMPRTGTCTCVEQYAINPFPLLTVTQTSISQWLYIQLWKSDRAFAGSPVLPLESTTG